MEKKLKNVIMRSHFYRDRNIYAPYSSVTDSNTPSKGTVISS